MGPSALLLLHSGPDGKDQGWETLPLNDWLNLLSPISGKPVEFFYPTKPLSCPVYVSDIEERACRRELPDEQSESHPRKRQASQHRRNAELAAYPAPEAE